jgi:hypothetical protein
MRSQRSRPRLVEVEDLDNSQHLCSLTWYSISLISNIDFTCKMGRIPPPNRF